MKLSVCSLPSRPLEAKNSASSSALGIEVVGPATVGAIVNGAVVVSSVDGAVRGVVEVVEVVVVGAGATVVVVVASVVCGAGSGASSPDTTTGAAGSSAIASSLAETTSAASTDDSINVSNDGELVWSVSSRALSAESASTSACGTSSVTSGVVGSSPPSATSRATPASSRCGVLIASSVAGSESERSVTTPLAVGIPSSANVSASAIPRAPIINAAVRTAATSGRLDWFCSRYSIGSIVRSILTRYRGAAAFGLATGLSGTALAMLTGLGAATLRPASTSSKRAVSLIALWGLSAGFFAMPRSMRLMTEVGVSTGRSPTGTGSLVMALMTSIGAVISGVT